MRRVNSAQRGHQTMLGAIVARLSPASLGYREAAQHWRRAPFGKGGSHKGNARRAAKRKAVVRARKLGHA